MRMEQAKIFYRVALLTVGLIALSGSEFLAVAGNVDAELQKQPIFSEIGMALESARLEPEAVRSEALEKVAQSMLSLIENGIPSEQQSAAYYLWGEIRFAQGDYAGAMDEYRKSVKKGDDEAHADDAAYARIVALEATGRDEEAAKEWVKWEKKYRESPLLSEAMLSRSWNALRLDSLSLASKVIDDLKTRFPNMLDDPRVILASATLAYLDGRATDALGMLSRMKSTTSTSRQANVSGLSYDIGAPTAFLRALCNVANGEMLQAAANFQEIVDRYPESRLRDPAMLAKADIFLSSQAYRSATEEFARVMEQSTSPDVAAEAQLRRATSVILDGNYGEGTDLLRGVVANHPGTVVGARAQYLLGEVLMSQSNHEDAILEFNRVLTEYFEHSLAASAQYRVGRCLDALGRQIEATSSYQAVVSGYPLSPESPAAAYLAGAGLLDQNLPLAAAPYFQLVLDRYARDDTDGKYVFASPEHQELVEAALCLLELSYHRAGNLGQLSGVPHLMLQKMPPSKSTWRAYALLIDADALAAQARYAEAQATLDMLISEFPGHPVGISAKRLLAWTYAQEGHNERAMQIEADMLKRYSGQGDIAGMNSAYLNRAHILFNQKKYGDAASSYEDFLHRYPTHPKANLARYQAGLAYQRLGRTGDAVDRWEEIVASDTTSEIAERAWVRAGDLYFQAAHYKDAKRCYQGLLDHFSHSRVVPMAMLRLAQCEYNAGNDREALERYSVVEAQYPGSEIADAAMKGIEQALYRLGKREDGSKILAELVDKYPTSSFAADAQFEIAMRHYNAKRYGEAADAFRRVVSQFPGYVSADRAQYLMAEAYTQIDSTRQARLALEQFILFFPESELYTTVRFHLGSLRFMENDYMRAAVDYTTVLSEPDITKEIATASLYNLALCQRLMGQDVEAQTLLERYRKENPAGDERNADIAYQMGDIHEKAGRSELAIQEFSKALAAKPGTDLATEIHYRIGSCREHLSDDEQAIAAYRKAMAATDKDDAFRLSALVRCAALYEKTGKYDKALSAYRDLIKNSQDQELVVAAKERISYLEANGK
jgi:TolA-binding protein